MMGGGSLTAIIQELIGGVAVVVLNRKSEELNQKRPLRSERKSRQFEAAPGTPVHHESKKAATVTSNTTDASAQICDGRYASTYQLAHCSHRPTSPELNPTEFPVQRQGPCRNEGHFEVAGSPYRARGSSAAAASPSFRLTSPGRDRGFSYTTRSPPERDDAFASSLRRYPSTTSYPSAEELQRFLRRQSKLLDKALRHAKSLRTLSNSKHSNICIKKSSKTLNLNRRKKEQTVGEDWSRKFVTLQTNVKQKVFRSLECRSPAPCCSRTIRPPRPCDYNKSIPQPVPVTASCERKAVIDSIRESLRAVYGQTGRPMAAYNVCPRMIDRLEKHRRDFHESKPINTSNGSSPKSLHRLKVQKSSDYCTGGKHGKILPGKNRSRIKIEKEKVVCECEEAMQERQKKQKTGNTCECLTASSSKPLERTNLAKNQQTITRGLCACDAKICKCGLDNAICECSVPMKEPSPTLDCECVIEDWLSELPIQAKERPKDKATRDKIIKELVKTIAAMDNDKFNKEGLNEIKKHVHRMPMWLPKDKDKKESFIDEISNNLFDRFKSLRDEKSRAAQSTILDELSEDLTNEILSLPKKGNQPVGVMTHELRNLHEQLVLDVLNQVPEFDNMSENKKKMAAKDLTRTLSDLLIQNSDDEKFERIENVMRVFIVRNWLDQLLRENSVDLAPEKQRQLITNIVQGSKAVQAKFPGQSPDRRGSKLEHSTGRLADGQPTNLQLRKLSPVGETGHPGQGFDRRLTNINSHNQAKRRYSSDSKQHSDGTYPITGQYKRHDCLHADKEASKPSIRKTSKNLRKQYAVEETGQPGQSFESHHQADQSQHAPDVINGNEYPKNYTSGVPPHFPQSPMKPGKANASQFPQTTRPEQDMSPFARNIPTPGQYPTEMRPDNQDPSQHYSEIRPSTRDPRQYPPGMRPSDPKLYHPTEKRPDAQDLSQYPTSIKFSSQDPIQYSPEKRPVTQERRNYSPNINGNQDPNQYPFEIRPGTQDPIQSSREMRPGTQEQSQYTPEMRPDNLDPNQYPSEIRTSIQKQNIPEIMPGNLGQDDGPYRSETQSSYKDPKPYAGNRNPNQYPSEIKNGTPDTSQYSPEMGAQEKRLYSPEIRPGNLDPNQYPSEIRPESLDPNQVPSKIKPGTQERDNPEIRPGTQDPRQFSSGMKPGPQKKRRDSPEITPGNLDPNNYPPETRTGAQKQNTPETRPGNLDQDAGPYTSETQSRYKDPYLYAGNLDPNQYPSEVRPRTQERDTSEIRPGTQDPSQDSTEKRPGPQKKSQDSPEITPGNLDPNKYPPEIRTGAQKQNTPETRPGNLDQDAGPYTSETQTRYKDPNLNAGNLDPNQYPSEVRPRTQERDTSEIRPGTQDPSQDSTEKRPGPQKKRRDSPEITPGNLDPNKYPPEIRTGAQKQNTPETRPGNLDQDAGPYTSETQTRYKDPNLYAGNLDPNQYPSEVRPRTQERDTSEIRPGTQDPSQDSTEKRPGPQKKRQDSPEITPGNLDPNKYPPEIRTGAQKQNTPETRPGNLDPRTQEQDTSEIRPGTQDPSQDSTEKRPGSQKKRRDSPEITPGNLDSNQYTFEKRPDNLGPNQYAIKTRPGIKENDIPELRPPNLDSKQYPPHKTSEDQGSRQHSPVKRPGYSDPRQHSPTVRSGDPRYYPGMHYPSNKTPGSQYPGHGNFSDKPPSLPDPRQHSPAIISGDPRYYPGMHYPSNKTPGSQNPGHGGSAGSPDRQRPLDIEPTSPGHKKTTLSNKEPSSTNEKNRDKIIMPNLKHLKESEIETAFANILKNEAVTQASTLMELLSLLEQLDNAGIHPGKLHEQLINHINELNEVLTKNQSYPHDGKPGTIPGKRNMSKIDKEDPSRNRSRNIARSKSPMRVIEKINVGAGPSRHIHSPRTPSRSPGRSLDDQRRDVRPDPVEKQVGTTRSRKNSDAEKIGRKAKNKNELVYFNELKNNIQKWMDGLGIDLKGNERNLASAMADEVLYRKKYVKLNPSAQTSREEELDDMKYQIFKMLKKKVDPETINLIMPHVDKLMGTLKDIPVPRLSDTEGKI